MDMVLHYNHRRPFGLPSGIGRLTMVGILLGAFVVAASACIVFMP